MRIKSVTPRTEHRLPRGILSAVEVERVLAVPDVTTVFGLRDRAILEVFYSTGIRRNELCHLDLADLDYVRCIGDNAVGVFGEVEILLNERV